MLLALEVPGAYPLLRSSNMKQNWQHNHLSFRRGHAKIRIPLQESAPAPKEIFPLYVEEIHMLEGLEDEKLERYVDENLRILARENLWKFCAGSPQQISKK